MATKKKTAKASLPRIFVSIASYRDPDCQHTVKDMFEKAAHPERIFAGICWQYVKGEDDFCFEVPYPRPEQVRVHEMNAYEAKGVCYARGLIQKLWKGEEFVLQIDSHMRFEPGWDDMLIDMWQQCGGKKAVLTCYPPGFTPPDTFKREWVFGMAAREFDAKGVLLMHGKPSYPVQNPPKEPIPGAFAGGCMLFMPASTIKDVPYDPHLYFFGEEISVAVRLWTHGYDFFHPNRLVIFHDWDRTKRKTHFEDHRDWPKRDERSFARLRHLLGMEPCDDPNITKDLHIYGLGKARTLEEYQTYSGVNFQHRTINAQALSGKYERYNPAEVKATLKKKQEKQPRIFVNIASYRDPECQWTVKDLFEKAAHPERVFVGICWQFDEKEDKHCFEVVTRPDQVRVFPTDWREAEGVCWARYMTQQLWDGEEYTLMIDSHMRFVQGWDELMLDELAACDSDKPVLSCSPAVYTPPNNLSAQTNPTIRRVRPFMNDGNLRCQGEMLDRAPEKPLPGMFMVANFVFSRSEIIQEVPYDPYLYFDQEEITYAVRLYTHGWDLFSARRQMLYHYYNTGKESVRPLHWNDLRKEDNARIRHLQERGLKRFNHLTGYEPSTDPEAIKELDVYGFGKVRTLQQFEEASGIDFKHKIASERALRCLFIEDLYKYRSRSIYVPELDDPDISKAYKTRTGLPLEIGDLIPFFELEDTNRKTTNIELYGGRHGLIFFLPAGDTDYLVPFFKRLQETFPKDPNLWQIFIFRDTAENLAAFRQKTKLPHLWFADPQGAVAEAFGVCRAGDKNIRPAGYLLSNNLRIMERHIGLDAPVLASTLAGALDKAVTAHNRKYASPKVISEIAPALIVPNVFSPELCKKCIEAFKSGKIIEGKVGEDSVYRPDAKIRDDFMVGGVLLDEIDQALSRTLFPEMEKVFGFEVRHRERYKIGLYSGEKKGFFKAHRDNFTPLLSYRRVAMTLHLNDDFEGGGVSFPEYGKDVYSPKLGGAIAFSCSTMHEALPVTKGDRIILVGFFHGEEDEAYRRYHQAKEKKPPPINDYIPRRKTYPKLATSRHLYRDWKEQNVRITATGAAPALAVAQVQSASPVIAAQPQMGASGSGPKKVFESKQVIVFDDFLPEDTYQRVYDFALRTPYEYINTKGKVSRAWHIHDGFPLRSMLNMFYYAPNMEKPQGDHVYPTKTAFDTFMEHLLALQAQVEHFTGKQGERWGHVTATSWIYPPGTGLSLHDDGSNVYSGAYVYFLNPTWRMHWGGMLLMLDDEANRRVFEHRNKHQPMEFYEKKWLNANAIDDVAMEYGFSQCIMPKKNRLVFIANDAYHMVTRVNEAAGDNVRMSVAGFFNHKKKPKDDKGGGQANY